MSEWTVKDLVVRGAKPDVITKSLEIAKISRLGMNVYDTVVDGIPKGRIEYLLWTYGKCLVWRSSLLGWVVTQMNETGWDINGFPNRWVPVPDRYISGLDTPEMSEDNDCVAFYDTSCYTIKRSDILFYCKDYADVTETIRTQVFNQKTPLIAVCANPSVKNKLKNAITSVAENVKVLFLDKSLNDNVEPLNFNAPYNVDSLWQYRKALENDMLEFIGIDSKDAYQKKERLVVDEQEGNDELLNYLLADGLKVREDACNKLRYKGVNATTKIQEIVRPIDSEEMTTPQDGDNDA